MSEVSQVHITRLTELSAKIGSVCSNPLSRPVYVHWSDAHLLAEAAAHIAMLERRCAALISASVISQATVLGLLPPDKPSSGP